MELDLIPKQIPFKLPSSLDGQAKTWDLHYPVSSNWNKAKKRFLFVIDHVPSENLKTKILLSGETGTLFVNLLNQANLMAKSWGCKTDIDECGVAFVSWSYFKTYNLDKSNAAVANTSNVDRMERIFKKLDPTHVHFFGESPAQEMFKIDVEKRGWVMRKKANNGKIWVSTNISVTNEAKFYDDSDDDDDTGENLNDDALGVDKSNLLGYACNNLARILHGSYPYSLNHLKPNYNYIDTMKKWTKLFKRLQTARCFAYDLETDNLSAMCNRILTAQFTLPDTPDICEFLPLKHYDAPWSLNELKQIYTDLRSLFTKEYDQEDWNIPYLIGQNLSFDLRVTRIELGIPVIYYRVWDLMAGEHCFHPDTIVDTEKGEMRIMDLALAHSNGDKIKVKSFNHNTGQIEYKDIVNALCHTTQERMLEIDFGSGTVRITENHKVWSVTRNCYVRAIDIQPDEEVILDKT